MIVQTMVGTDMAITRIAKDDILFLLDGKEYEYMGEIMLIEERYAVAMVAISKYSEIRREALKDWPAQFDGNRGARGLTKEEAELFAPKEVEMNTLLSDFTEKLDADCLMVKRLLEAFPEKARAYFKDESFPNVKVIA